MIYPSIIFFNTLNLLLKITIIILLIINATIMNIKKSIISGENKIETEPDDDFSENPNNIDQLLKDLEKQMDFNEILGNVGEQNNSNNNIDNTINMNNQHQQSNVIIILFV